MNGMALINSWTVLVLSMLMTTVIATPNCKTVNEKDVVCTAGESDYVLKRGLVSDNNKTTGITLRGCRITKVDYEAFENDFYLQYIDLSDNRISYIQLGVLDGNNDMRHLNLSHNFLTAFPLGLFDQYPNLEVLDLKANKINTLELGIFDPLRKLRYLDLSSNELLGRNISPYIFDQSTGITFIDLSRNDMSGAPVILFNHFYVLDTLNMDRCSLAEVPEFALTHNLKTMKRLTLTTNLITKINNSTMFVGLEKLEILSLAENFIDDISENVLWPLGKLKIIDLRKNKLRTIPDRLFQNMANLVNIDLSHNLIEYVPVNAFRGTLLKNLNLASNKFTFLESNFCLELNNSGARLTKFYFNNNDWQCACLHEILREVRKYNIGYNSAKYDGEHIVCLMTNEFTCKRSKSSIGLSVFYSK